MPRLHRSVADFSAGAAGRGSLFTVRILIERRIRYDLFGALRPNNSNFRDGSFPPNSNKHPVVVGGEIAARSARYGVLGATAGGGQRELGAEAISVFSRGPEVEHNPIVFGPALVSQNMGRSVEGCHDRVNVAVIIEVAEGRAPARPCLSVNFPRLNVSRRSIWV